MRGELRMRLRLDAVALLLVTAATLTACSGPADEGRELEAQGDIAGAVSLYEEALLEDPDGVEILTALGADLMLLGKYDEALPVQERVISLDQNDVQTRIELGFNYLNHQDRAEDAARVLGQAVSLDPTAQHLTFLAQAQIVSGEDETAEGTLREAIQSDPDYAFSYRVLYALLLSQGRTDEALQLRSAALARGLRLDGE